MSKKKTNQQQTNALSYKELNAKILPELHLLAAQMGICLLYTSPSPRD